MISRATDRFWNCFYSLPDNVKKQSKQTYKLFLANPYHLSLRFKRVHSQRPIYSVRISLDYRAIGIQQNNEIIWFWIGSHKDYKKLLKQFR